MEFVVAVAPLAVATYAGVGIGMYTEIGGGEARAGPFKPKLPGVNEVAGEPITAKQIQQYAVNLVRVSIPSSSYLKGATMGALRCGRLSPRQ